ncbi:hypothetical protein SAV31267_060760 [Streptomyces avermitilis]|uniref:RNA polymerase ECF-subfamily sigma factor n=1 Tax=Streptomyces avermitilis TaxID=33903 RepID=A0A4D4MWM9_STRAX|nr:hypothetical protein SAV31267_060760 [Streptomyces avermitilis]
MSEAEFTAYVQERRASLYATAYHLTGDRFEAEDLLQSALFSTYRAWDRISDKAAVGGYLRRTMTNLHISAWRRRKLNEYPTEELPETAGDTDAMRGTELRAVLWQALARLPELQRTMLVLRYYEGRTDPEIAEILDISVGTVKSSIWRSLRRLREDEVLSFGRDEEESFGSLSPEGLGEQVTGEHGGSTGERYRGTNGVTGTAGDATPARGSTKRAGLEGRGSIQSRFFVPLPAAAPGPRPSPSRSVPPPLPPCGPVPRPGRRGGRRGPSAG